MPADLSGLLAVSLLLSATSMVTDSSDEDDDEDDMWPDAPVTSSRLGLGMVTGLAMPGSGGVLWTGLGICGRGRGIGSGRGGSVRGGSVRGGSVRGGSVRGGLTTVEPRTGDTLTLSVCICIRATC